MNQQLFVVNNGPRWRAFEKLLQQVERNLPAGATDFPLQYRLICRDLALAQQKQFDAYVVDNLNDLALRGHQAIYQPPRGTWKKVWTFCVVDFPETVRKESRPILLVIALFYLTCAVVMLAVLRQSQLVYSFLDPARVVVMEEMYDPSSLHHLRPRDVDTDAGMFGFYIRNNISVGFRTFAGGIFGGIGSLFFLLINAVYLGAVAGHMLHVGLGHTFFPFIIGHCAFELTALLFMAAAGFRLGWSLIAPGPYGRLDALRLSTRGAVPVLYGSVAMLLIAASIEAFWSSSRVIPAWAKYSVGGLLWLVVIAYFLLVGRSSEN